MNLAEALLARVFSRGPAGKRAAAWAEKNLVKTLGKAPESIERTLARLARFSERTARLYLADARALARAMQDMFPKAFKQGLEKLTPKDWLELLLKAGGVGKGQVKKLKGYLAEILVQYMSHLPMLVAELELRAANAGARWVPKVRVIREVTDLAGRELGDYMLVVESAARTNGEPDEIWIMAIIESKSLSNTDDLIGHGEAGLIGQHKYDLIRIQRSGGIRIDGHNVPARKLKYGTPWTRGETPEFVTRFIGVAPRKLKPGELNRLEWAGVLVEVWQHTIDNETLDSVSAMFLKAAGSQ